MKKEINPTKKQKKEIQKLSWELLDFQKRMNLKTIPLNYVFGNNIPEGDFRWGDDADPGDPYPYECDEYDCEAGWHLAYYNDVCGRENGKLFIETYIGDEDGNWEFDDGWEEDVDPSIILGTLAQRLDNYFIDWGKYWLYCAENAQEIWEKGKDPLNQVIRLSEIKPKKLVEFFLGSAREDVKYLHM